MPSTTRGLMTTSFALALNVIAACEKHGPEAPTPAPAPPMHAGAADSSIGRIEDALKGLGFHRGDYAREAEPFLIRSVDARLATVSGLRYIGMQREAASGSITADVVCKDSGGCPAVRSEMVIKTDEIGADTAAAFAAPMKLATSEEVDKKIADYLSRTIYTVSEKPDAAGRYQAEHVVTYTMAVQQTVSNGGIDVVFNLVDDAIQANSNGPTSCRVADNAQPAQPTGSDAIDEDVAAYCDARVAQAKSEVEWNDCARRWASGNCSKDEMATMKNSADAAKLRAEQAFSPLRRLMVPDSGTDADRSAAKIRQARIDDAVGQCMRDRVKPVYGNQ